MTKSSEIYYLAVPYSAPDAETREYRYEMVTKLASVLVAGGLRVYSPITHSHPMCDHNTGNHIQDWWGWLEFERPFMEFCTQLIVYCLPGWMDSSGVKLEMKTMKGKPVHYVYDDNLAGYPRNRKDVRFFVHSENGNCSEIVQSLERGVNATPVYPFGEVERRPMSDLILSDGRNMTAEMNHLTKEVKLSNIIEGIICLVTEGPEVSPRAKIYKAVQDEAAKALEIIRERNKG